jgi:8-oxo-dGTP pyrophosphatase MutT (NUDIX family)
MTLPSRPVVPAPAATLVLLRDRPGGGVEVLLIQRHGSSRFAAGDFVFPGGKIEPQDMPDDAPAWCVGITAEEARARLGNAASARLALGHWVGAIREAFEEVGILLAYGPDGSLLRLAGEAKARFERHRRACQQDGSAFWRMLREERLQLAADRLVYFAHWITPEENPIRFDTRFFAAEAPLEQEAVADNQEIIAVRWLSPAEALGAQRRGEIPLRFPTIKNLELVEGPSHAAVLASLDGRSVPTIRPRVIGKGPSRRVLLPGDAGWY